MKRRRRKKSIGLKCETRVSEILAFGYYVKYLETHLVRQCEAQHMILFDEILHLIDDA